MYVIKRNGKTVMFDKEKITEAIMKAMKYGSGIIDTEVARLIAVEIENEAFSQIDISKIEELVYSKLNKYGHGITARAYEGYRAVREYQREQLIIDERITGIVNGSNIEAIKENSNKNAYIASTQRDLIAGEYSKDYCDRKMLPANIVQAENQGVIHFHDKDYFIQPIFNCCLVDLKDMLNNGTVINSKFIEKPKSFQTACTVATQIVQQIANGQYGGQTISLAHLSPFVRISHEKHKKRIIEEGLQIGVHYNENQLKQLIDIRLEREIAEGIQTIQYQINTFSTSNGQAPFLSIFMYINEEIGYEKETAMLIEAILNLRYLGMKNEVGVYITPSFPKLIYVLDENNIYEDSEYKFLTDLAIKTVAKRMMPDFISAKKMKEYHNGQVYPPMGCRSFLSEYIDEDGQYKWYGRFNQGVVTLNLADVGLSAEKNLDRFWDILEHRLELCYQALMLRHEMLCDVTASISPIHWQYGGIKRLKKGEIIKPLLFGGYSTLSLGYIGLYECVMSMIGKSHTSKEGEILALKIIKKMNNKCEDWKKKTNIGFALYGTPSESTTFTLAKKMRDKYGLIKDITDKDYLTNSYHVNVKEKINAFEKLSFEAKFQKQSPGGCISYVEVPNLCNNLKVLKKIVEFMYHNIKYAEINTKSDYCMDCGFTGEILLDDNLEWFCPECGNKNEDTMNVCRRTCGYLGDNFWNKGRTQEISERVMHLDNEILESVKLV
ncbi:MAG: anaerobic ribonucleoside-triphosphate reductase [Firmicutes bacterium]|nr:anaerobic ribonucleoside-triphosphate reductase [Bacillota bacterium]